MWKFIIFLKLIMMGILDASANNHHELEFARKDDKSFSLPI